MKKVGGTATGARVSSQTPVGGVVGTWENLKSPFWKKKSIACMGMVLKLTLYSRNIMFNF